MSRIRTGIKPSDWYIEEPATHVARKLSGTGGAAIGGIFVVGPSTAQKHAEEVAAYKARLAEKMT